MAVVFRKVSHTATAGLISDSQRQWRHCISYFMQHGTPEIGSPSRSQRTRNLRSHHSDREHPLKEFPLGYFPQRFRLSTNTGPFELSFAVRSSQQASHAISAAVVVLTGPTRSLFLKIAARPSYEGLLPPATRDLGCAVQRELSAIAKLGTSGVRKGHSHAISLIDAGQRVNAEQTGTDPVLHRHARWPR